jgi:hypothetical protein
VVRRTLSAISLHVSLIRDPRHIGGMKVEMKSEGDKFVMKRASPRVIISIDAGKRQRQAAVAIQHFVHGRSVTARVAGGRKRYFYPGLASRPGVEKLGQSVLMMREKDAEDFAAFLRRHLVRFEWIRVWIEEADPVRDHPEEEGHGASPADNRPCLTS